MNVVHSRKQPIPNLGDPIQYRLRHFKPIINASLMPEPLWCYCMWPCETCMVQDKKRGE